MKDEVQECDLCGRELPSHHLGCAGVAWTVVDEAHDWTPEEMEEVQSAFDTESPTCANEGCQDAPKPYGGRGPRPKFCAAHSAGKGK